MRNPIITIEPPKITLARAQPRNTEELLEYKGNLKMPPPPPGTTQRPNTTGTAKVSIVPKKFVNDHGKLMMRSAVTTTLKGARGSVPHTKMMNLQVKDVTSTVAGPGVTAASCDILNLVLGPLDLNLLGLEVHLAQVVLDIDGTTGAGNLLGNLLCAVAGLLDGGAALGQIAALLNQILGILNGLGA